MNFVDVSQYKIVNMNRFSTLRIKLDGDKYLDAPISEGSKYMQSLLNCTFRTPSVVYRVKVDLKEPTFDDFEIICDNLVAAIFRQNAKEDVLRTDDELRYVLNKLPSNRWTLKQQFAAQVHCDTSTLLRVAHFGWRNRNLNIFIETTDGQYKYELIGESK